MNNTNNIKGRDIFAGLETPYTNLSDLDLLKSLLNSDFFKSCEHNLFIGLVYEPKNSKISLVQLNSVDAITELSLLDDEPTDQQTEAIEPKTPVLTTKAPLKNNALWTDFYRGS
jgi:hypothetical protein